MFSYTLLAIFSGVWLLTPTEAIGLKFKKFKIVPDVISIAPYQKMTVKYPNGTILNLGTYVKTVNVKGAPDVSWLNKGQYHTLVMVDSDAGDFSEVNHWLIGNIPGDDIQRGEIIAEYFGSIPDSGSGTHRCIFLVFKQRALINFNEPYSGFMDTANRIKFRVRDFAKKYSLGNPIAGNFYLVGWDEYVPVIRKELGLD
ncbi:hypothetical protein DMENIID0001_080350 [Sergentomyia squamirostris]